MNVKGHYLVQKRKTFAALRFLPIASIIATALIYGISSLATAGVGLRGVPSARSNAILPMIPFADNAPNDRYRSLKRFSANVYNRTAKPAGSSTTDSNTLLSLRFENTLNGENGESPVSSEGTSFQTGLQGQGVHIPTGGQITYLAADNINAREGTIEFWIKPNWNGNDNQSHTILNWNGGAAGGFLITKHNHNKLALSVDRWVSWLGVEVDVSTWQAGQWYHVAATYSNTSKSLQLFINGSVKNEVGFSGELPLIAAPNFTLGNYYESTYLNATLDEFRVSNRVRTSEEIAAHFVESLMVNSISVDTVTKNLWPTWRVPATIDAETNAGPLTFSASVASWTSSSPGVATVNSEGQLVAIAPGSATLTADVKGAQSDITVKVNAPMRPPRIEVPTGSRAEPADGALYEMPVVSLRYIPTADGVNLDLVWAPGFFGLEPITIATLEQRLDSYDEIRKFMLEEGSRFRGYGSQTPPPSLGYKVVATITVYEPPPPGKSFQPYGYHSEWFQMFERLGLQNYVENLGVKEIWYYTGQLDSNIPAYDPAIHPAENFRGTWESNMASPTTTDVSNSNRDNTDLPIYDRTYIILHQWIRRLDNLTVHIDGHQWEQMLVYVNELRDGNNRLFWGKFVGYDANNVFQRGRAGWTHFAPNSINDYDYINFNPFNSDITDWKPEGGGQLISYSAATARDTPYVFPNNYLPPPRTEPHWYIYWRQSMPGFGNTITFDASALQAVNAAGKKVETSRAEEICVAKGDHFETIKRATWETSPQVRIGKVTDRNGSNQIESVESSGVNRMTNWWHFNGNWDAAIRAGLGLYEPNSCTYTLSAVNHNIPAAGGAGSITVTAPTGCKWFASSNALWTSIQGTDIGNGTGTVSFSVPANTTTSARSTSIVVAGKPVVINQASSSAGPTPTPTPTPIPTPTPTSTLQFSAAGYNVNEGASSLTVTVNRTGDPTGTSTVDYRTIDNQAAIRCDEIGTIAFARCDYVTAVGTLSFAAGVSSLTFTISVVDDAFNEINETFDVGLSNVTGATLGTSTATVTIIDNDAVDGANPIFTTPFFVRQHYLDFLSREPKPGEPWSAVLNNCSDVNNDPTCDRLTVSAAFFGSPEFQLKGYFVYRFYKLAFNRLPTYEEISTDMAAVTGQTAADVFARKAAFTNAFVMPQEFIDAFDTLNNTQYVEALMGRYSLTQITTPDPANPDGTQKVTRTTAELITGLNGATLTRAQVLRAIADSDQVFSLEFNQAFVAMQYFGYLRRAPEQAGFDAWLNYLNANPTDFRTMVNGFMNSIEYRLRFGPQ